LKAWIARRGLAGALTFNGRVTAHQPRVGEGKQDAGTRNGADEL